MREGKPSFTAAIVAAARAVAPSRRDPHASDLVAGPLRGIVRAIAERPRLREVARRASLGLVDHIALRTAAIDAEVERAAGEGIAQLVLLGAGLDARAWRLAGPGVAVFEVDHPDTQRSKQERAPTIGAPTYVPVRFGEERVADALADAGHDAGAPTFWIWEGVTMYLPRAAVADTLTQVAERSAPGSRLAVTYVTGHGPTFAPGLERVVQTSFRVLGEGLDAHYRPEEFAALLSEHGFEVTSDRGSAGWSREWGGDPRWAGALLAAERLCIAETNS